MSDLVDILSENFLVSALAFCFILSVIIKATTTVLTTHSRERTRREIAAYIAEGSISPEQGERLLKAQIDGKPDRSC